MPENAIFLRHFARGGARNLPTEGLELPTGGAKMIEKGCFRALYCQISSDENQNFLRRGAVAP